MLTLNLLKNWRFEMGLKILKLKQSWMQPEQLGCYTIAKTSLDRAIFSSETPYKLKSQISHLKSVEAVGRAADSTDFRS